MGSRLRQARGDLGSGGAGDPTEAVEHLASVQTAGWPADPDGRHGLALRVEDRRRDAGRFRVPLAIVDGIATLADLLQQATQRRGVRHGLVGQAGESLGDQGLGSLG